MKNRIKALPALIVLLGLAIVAGVMVIRRARDRHQAALPAQAALPVQPATASDCGSCATGCDPCGKGSSKESPFVEKKNTKKRRAGRRRRASQQIDQRVENDTQDIESAGVPLASEAPEVVDNAPVTNSESAAMVFVPPRRTQAPALLDAPTITDNSAAVSSAVNESSCFSCAPCPDRGCDGVPAPVCEQDVCSAVAEPIKTRQIVSHAVNHMRKGRNHCLTDLLQLVDIETSLVELLVQGYRGYSIQGLVKERDDILAYSSRSVLKLYDTILDHATDQKEFESQLGSATDCCLHQALCNDDKQDFLCFMHSVLNHYSHYLNVRR